MQILLQSSCVKKSVVIPHYIIIVIMQNYPRALNISKACQVYCIECVSKIKPILSIIVYAIYGALRFHLTHFSCYILGICAIYRLSIIESEVLTIIHYG